MFSYIFFLKSGDYYDKTASAKSYLPKSLPLEAFELKSESFNELRDNVYWLRQTYFIPLYLCFVKKKVGIGAMRVLKLMFPKNAREM